MERQEIVDRISSVLSQARPKKNGMTFQSIVNKFNGDGLFTEMEEPERIKKVLKEECNNAADGRFEKVPNKRDTYRLKTPTIVKRQDNLNEIPTNYIGKGGEYAVMSELLFSGYNANTMTVDDGIDIVASKDNIFYYIQVKTTTSGNNGKYIVQIKRTSFNRVQSNNVKYVVVIRSGIGETKFFVFDQKNIEMFYTLKCVKMNEDNIIIKIRIDECGNPYLYDEKEMDIAFFQNNF